MISLKTYLLGGPDKDPGKEVETSYGRMIDLFLQGVSLHAVEGDKVDYSQFRSDMDGFALRLTSEQPISERFVVVSEALRALADYNRRTSQYLRTQNAELQKMITMLTQTVIAVGTNSETSVAGLQGIERALEETRLVDDVRLVKAQLGECLQTVRVEAVRQIEEGKATRASIQRELARSQDRIGGFSVGPRVDPVTGLRGMVEAQQALQAASAEPGNKFLLLFVVNRLQAVNARFGTVIGDQVLALAAEHFRGALPAEDILYRWHGPALVAVLSRTSDIGYVRDEIRLFAEKKLEKNFAIGSRSVLLPISTSWTVFPIVPPVDALLRKVEVFTAAQLSRDYAWASSNS